MSALARILSTRFRLSIPNAVRRHFENEPLLPTVQGDGGASHMPKDLATNVAALVALEQERTKLHLDIMEMERRADEIFNSFTGHTTFAILFSGGGLIFQSPVLQCSAVKIFSAMIIGAFLLAFGVAFWVMRIRLGRMKLCINDLDSRKRALAARARPILDLEKSRSAATNEEEQPGHAIVGEQSDQRVLDVDEELDKVVLAAEAATRANKVVDSGNVVELEKYYCQLALTTFLCLAVYGSLLYYLAYYTYCDAKKKCNEHRI